MDMQRAAAEALADVMPADSVGPDRVIPECSTMGLVDAVARAVSDAS